MSNRPPVIDRQIAVVHWPAGRSGNRTLRPTIDHLFLGRNHYDRELDGIYEQAPEPDAPASRVAHRSEVLSYLDQCLREGATVHLESVVLFPTKEER